MWNDETDYVKESIAEQLVTICVTSFSTLFAVGLILSIAM